MEPYKKRAKNGWRCGKYAKRESNKEERTFAKEDIRQELKQHNEGEDFRYRYKTTITKNEKMRIEHRISWYERIIETYKRRDEQREAQGLDPYHCFRPGHWLSSLNKLKKKYEEKYGITNDCK